MRNTHTVMAVLLVGLLLAMGCGGEPQQPADTVTAGELLANPTYDANVRLYGQVSELGELFCPCFRLSSGEASVMVWHDLMVEDDGTQRPPVSVEDIKNGDWVVVTGELKSAGTYRSLNDVWAREIAGVR
jgi:hypothetical protein